MHRQGTSSLASWWKIRGYQSRSEALKQARIQVTYAKTSPVAPRPHQEISDFNKYHFFGTRNPPATYEQAAEGTASLASNSRRWSPVQLEGMSVQGMRMIYSVL